MNSLNSVANRFASTKEEILSSTENPNGTTSVKYTSKRINLLFLSVIIIPIVIVSAIAYGYGQNSPLVVCQESYMKATNSIQRYNEENPDYPISLPEYNCNQLLNLTISGASSPPPERQEVSSNRWEGLDENNIVISDWLNSQEIEKLSSLQNKICKKQVNSPLCKEDWLLERLYILTEARLPGKNFFPILIGMTNAESSLGLDFAKDNVGGRCDGRNNWGGAKYNIKDDNTREYSRHYNGYLYGEEFTGRFVDQYGCNLFPFKSIEEYWISKVNGIRYGYKGCIDHSRPVWCISGAYVGSPALHEQNWINNVSIFL